MGCIYFLFIRHKIKTRYDNLISIYDGFSRFIQFSVESIAVRTHCYPFHRSVRCDPGYGVGRKIRHINIAVLVNGHTIRTFQILRILRPDLIFFHRTVFVERDLMYSTISEVAHVKVALMIEYNTVHAILAFGILRDKCQEDFLVIQRVRAVDILRIQRKAVYTAHQIS